MKVEGVICFFIYFTFSLKRTKKYGHFWPYMLHEKKYTSEQKKKNVVILFYLCF